MLSGSGFWSLGCLGLGAWRLGFQVVEDLGVQRFGV